jgi:hypothetical protein
LHLHIRRGAPRSPHSGNPPCSLILPARGTIQEHGTYPRPSRTTLSLTPGLDREADSPERARHPLFEKLHRHGPLSTRYLVAYSLLLRKSATRAKDRLADLFNEDELVVGHIERKETGGFGYVFLRGIGDEAIGQCGCPRWASIRRTVEGGRASATRRSTAEKRGRRSRFDDTQISRPRPWDVGAARTQREARRPTSRVSGLSARRLCRGQPGYLQCRRRV